MSVKRTTWAVSEIRDMATHVPPQAADVLGISARTADNYWAHARAWLFRELKANKDP